MMKPVVLVAMCVFGHESNCHAASDMGIHECADCSCRSFQWDGGDRVPPAPNRDWISGAKEGR
jgi:hypothetical protein